MKPLVLYHANCWDGFCAAWVARKALGEIEAVAVSYGTPAPDVNGREVYIVDFSYKRPEMREILSVARSVVVLDHHKTAETELDGIVDEFCLRPDLNANPPNSAIPIVRFDLDKSGGRLAWEHFAYIGGWQDMQAPWLVDYTEDRDLWRHKLPYSEEVNAALRSYPLSFDMWDRFSTLTQNAFVDEGKAIRRREKQIVNEHTRHARRIRFDGHMIWAVNATVLYSEIAGELAKGEPFAAVYFDRDDGKRQWSLRSDDGGLDVSKIAFARGGGGHFHAAGFEEAERIAV